MEILILLGCFGFLALLGARYFGSFAKPFLTAIAVLLLANVGIWIFLHLVLGVTAAALYWISMLTVPLSLIVAAVAGFRTARGSEERKPDGVTPKQVFGAVVILTVFGMLYFAGVPTFLLARVGLICSPLVPSSRCTAAEAVKKGNIRICFRAGDVSQQDECRRIFARKAPGPESCGEASKQNSIEHALCWANYKASEKFDPYCDELAKADRYEALVAAGCGRSLATWISPSTGRNLFVATAAYNRERGARVSDLCANQLRELAGYGANPGAKDRDGNTAWHYASFNCFGELVDKHSNLLNEPNNKGETPLMVLLQDGGPAFLSGHRLKTMAEAGMKVTATDQAGQTALHHLMKNRRVHDPSELARALVELGADPDAKDAGGIGPRELARERGLDEGIFQKPN